MRIPFLISQGAICQYNNPSHHFPSSSGQLHTLQYYSSRRIISRTVLSSSDATRDSDHSSHGQDEHGKFAYITEPEVSSREDLFDLPYLPETALDRGNNFTTDFGLPQGVKRLSPTEVRIADDNIVEEVDKFRFRMNVDELAKLQQGSSGRIAANQMTDNEEVLPHGEIEFDESLLQALQSAEVVDQGDTVTYKLELDMDDFKQLIKDSDSSTSSRTIDMSNETERNQYIAQLKPNKISSGYDEAKRLIRKYFTEFGKLAEDRNTRHAGQKSKFSFFHFLQLMEFPGKKELFSELISTKIVFWSTTLLIFLFDKMIKTCANLINESFDVLMRRLGWKIRIRPDFLLLVGVYLIYPTVKYLQKRKPDLSFAGFESD